MTRQEKEWNQIEKEFDQSFSLGSLPEQKDILSLLETFGKMTNPPKTMTEIMIAEGEYNRQKMIREYIKIFFHQKFQEAIEKAKWEIACLAMDNIKALPVFSKEETLDNQLYIKRRLEFLKAQ